MDEQNTNQELPREQLAAIVCNCTRLNVRNKPNKDSNVLCIVNSGTSLIVNGESNGWARVYTPDGIRGYVMTDYIEEDI